MIQRCFHRLLVLALLVACAIVSAPSAGYCQHSIDVQRLAAKGDYLAALGTYDKMPKRVATTEAIVSAGRSAWALSLPERAAEEFDRALHDQKLSAVERSRLLLTRGIIEFQEGRYQVATLFAEKAAHQLSEESALRSKIWLLWAESLYKLNSFGSAEQYYLKALEEAPKEDRAEIHYLLGRCRLKVGKETDAKSDFENVPMDHERTPLAMRHLAHIALTAGEYSQAAFWLQTGRQQFPDSFLDSWVDYALVSAAVNAKDLKRVREIRADAQKKYPPSDYWLTLLEASAESFEWEQVSK